VTEHQVSTDSDPKTLAEYFARRISKRQDVILFLVNVIIIFGFLDSF